MGSIEDVLKELRGRIERALPPDITITDLQFEGHELVLYTPDPRRFADKGDLVRTLAREVRKRIVVRPDPKVLADPEEAKREIISIVPEDANITDFYFDEDTGEVIIETEKPGAVIGK
ncbi:MAG: beta-CASP ribonuclease aCPSF1, partial [Methermicoccaceae archaeon]